MRKYLQHVLIISFVFLLAPTAHVVSHAGELEDAKEEVRNNPDDADAHLNLGVAYGELGRHEEAIKSYKQAIKIDPDDALAHNNLGLAYYNTGKKQDIRRQSLLRSALLRSAPLRLARLSLALYRSAHRDKFA